MTLYFHACPWCGTGAVEDRGRAWGVVACAACGYWHARDRWVKGDRRLSPAHQARKDEIMGQARVDRKKLDGFLAQQLQQLQQSSKEA